MAIGWNHAVFCCDPHGIRQASRVGSMLVQAETQSQLCGSGFVPAGRKDQSFRTGLTSFQNRSGS